MKKEKLQHFTQRHFVPHYRTRCRQLEQAVLFHCQKCRVMGLRPKFSSRDPEIGKAFSHLHIFLTLNDQLGRRRCILHPARARLLTLTRYPGGEPCSRAHSVETLEHGGWAHLHYGTYTHRASWWEKTWHPPCTHGLHASRWCCTFNFFKRKIQRMEWK